MEYLRCQLCGKAWRECRCYGGDCHVPTKDLLARYAKSPEERSRMRRAMNALLVRVSWIRRRAFRSQSPSRTKGEV